MTELVTQKNTFMIAILAIALALGVPVTEYTYNELYTNELDNSYFCTADEGEKYAHEIMEFYKLSPSKHRGYPYEGTTKGYKDCGDNDIWVSVLEYSKLLDIPPYDFIEEKQKKSEPIELEQPKILKKGDIEGHGVCGPNEPCVYIE